MFCLSLNLSMQCPRQGNFFFTFNVEKWHEIAEFPGMLCQIVPVGYLLKTYPQSEFAKCQQNPSSHV